MHDLNLDDARWEGRLLQKTQRVMGWGGRPMMGELPRRPRLKGIFWKVADTPRMGARKSRGRDVHMTS